MVIWQAILFLKEGLTGSLRPLNFGPTLQLHYTLSFSLCSSTTLLVLVFAALYYTLSFSLIDVKKRSKQAVRLSFLQEKLIQLIF